MRSSSRQSNPEDNPPPAKRSEKQRATDPNARINPWESIPRKTVIVFLASVFFIFTSVGFANDIIDMGREPILRFVLDVLSSGLFAVLYASFGIAFRRKFWIPFIPIFALQFFAMGLLQRSLPNKPLPSTMNISETGLLRSRLTFDAVAVIIAVSLGYTGFAFVSVREGRRYGRIRSDMALLESEMAAAREIQQVMLPDRDESFPGFTIDSVYKPAREVGGDFFQILSTPEGLLVVFGDVAGKGLPAAMLVSMLVGSIRATAEETSDPSLILRKLHDRLLGRISGGFSTAIVARITRDGNVTIANAGNPSPYLDGRELDLPGALPLGIPNGGEYEPSTFSLTPGSSLTFISDGIVEAMKPDGELFGFDRTEAISTHPASAIAQAAVDFGQADDITVVTIERAVPA